jgi:serine/threonine protein kinase
MTRHIFLQLCTGGDLFTYITSHGESEGRLCEGEAKYIIYQLFKALDYLHKKEISHRGAPQTFSLRTTNNPHPVYNQDIKVSPFSDSRIPYSPILSPKTSYFMLQDPTLMCS